MIHSYRKNTTRAHIHVRRLIGSHAAEEQVESAGQLNSHRLIKYSFSICHAIGHALRGPSN